MSVHTNFLRVLFALNIKLLKKLSPTLFKYAMSKITSLDLHKPLYINYTYI